MDIFIPNKKLWIPDNTIADSLASPIGINRMIAYNKNIRCLTPHRVMMGAAGGIADDKTAYGLDGTGDYLTVPDSTDWEFGTGDFTIEMWLKLTSSAVGKNFIGRYNAGTSVEWSIAIVTGGLVQFWSPAFRVSSTTDVTDNALHHVAIVRSSGTTAIYIDGTSEDTDAVAYTVGSFAESLFIGTINLSGTPASRCTPGKFDEIRISDVARWTSDFTPESSQYTSDANTLLLIHSGETKIGTTGSGATFTDSGNTGHTVTENGDAIEDTTTYKF